MAEWLTGFVFKEKKLMARICNAQGFTEFLDPVELTTRGVPAEMRERKRFELDFSHFAPVDSSEYLEHFGFDDILDKNGQSCFEIRADGFRLLIPALVLLRALVRPNKLLLAKVLMAPGITSAVTLAADKKGLLFFQMPLGGMQRLASSVQNQLRWLLSSPSALKMQGTLSKSVAMDGRLDCSLPVGNLRCVVRGEMSGDTIYVTDLSPLALAGADNTDDEALIFHASLEVHGSGATLADSRSWTLPVRQNGEWSLTDSEWTSVFQIMQSRRNICERTINRRELLDALFEKLNNKVSWKAACRGRFSRTALPVLFRTLITCGAWSEIVKFLADSRATP